MENGLVGVLGVVAANRVAADPKHVCELAMTLLLATAAQAVKDLVLILSHATVMHVHQVFLT